MNPGVMMNPASGFDGEPQAIRLSMGDSPEEKQEMGKPSEGHMQATQPPIYNMSNFLMPTVQHPGGEDYYKYYQSPYGAYHQGYFMPNDYIQVMRPNFININNVNTMGNALIISGNPNGQMNMGSPQRPAEASPLKSVQVTQETPAKSPLPTGKIAAVGKDNGFFKVEVNYEYYRKLYSGA